MDKLLSPDTGLMFWTVVTFLALVFILRKTAWGPLLKAVEEREARLKADREAAEKARAEAERIQKDLEAKLSGAQAKGQDILAQAVKDGEQLRARLKGEAEADAQAIKEKTAAELAAEKTRLIGELRSEVSRLSILAAEKLLHKSVDEHVQKNVIEGFFKDLDAAKRRN